MQKDFLKFNEYIELNESGIRGMKDLAKQYKTAELYFHMDLDGVTSGIGMKAYLESYKIKVTRVQHIQYGGREFAAEKPKEGSLAVLVDFAHGKPMMHIHTDHHQGQIGVDVGTATDFKGAPSNAGTISQSISPRDLFPPEDVKLINMIDSASFAKNDISPDEVLKAAFKFDKSIGIEKNRTYMALVCNKVLLAFKNKPNFLEQVVEESKPSLISLFTTIRKIAIANKYPIDKLTDQSANYIKSQEPALKLKELKDTSEIFKLGDGEFAMFGTCLVQFGGGNMMKGGFDRYVSFKNNPSAEYFIMGWDLGLVQASKNPFKKGSNKYNLGDIANNIIKKYKSQLEKEIITFGQLKKQMESDIARKGSKQSFGFTLEDLRAIFGDAIKGTKFAAQNKDLIKNIAKVHYDDLIQSDKDILDQVKVNMYDVIIKQSGGHKDITNISGLNFLGKAEGTKLLKAIMSDLAEELKNCSLS